MVNDEWGSRSRQGVVKARGEFENNALTTNKARKDAGDYSDRRAEGGERVSCHIP